MIGGIGSIAGPILGALWVVGLPALWPDNDLIPILTSSVGLLNLLMYFPGGLFQIGLNARDALLVALATVQRRRRRRQTSTSVITTTTAERPVAHNADGMLATDDLKVTSAPESPSTA